VGFTVTVGLEQGTNLHAVTVRVKLNLVETNSLFLSGDTLVSWPPGELLQGEEPRLTGSAAGRELALERTSMFISELSRLAHGLKIGYRQAAEAARAAQLMRGQLVRAGIEEET
jgi:hypothetical protein